MKDKSFRRTVIELVRKGESPLTALKIAEDSGKFKEKEIQEWCDKFNEYRINK
ncbi:hypothetical protein AB0X74_05035 [Kurthia gibsonii]|uniref:hypothetical protein n=1 Tax=Kurthia gibsonii TaxID=33946 RepID=UPI003F2940D9